MRHNVLAVCYVCVPRPLGGDGVVFAGPAHARTFFWLQIYPAIIVGLGDQDFSIMHLMFQKEGAKTMTSIWNIPAC